MDVLAWLLDGDPAIRWQTLRDLTGAPPAEVAAERARVGREGWGARLLAARDADGLWAGGACFPAGYRGEGPGQPWTATMHSLQTLGLLGLDPASPEARDVRTRVDRHGRWEHAGQRYFDGEVEPCINGRTVEAGALLGADVSGVLDRLLGEQLEDGGWNCEAENGSVRSSFDTTACVLEGLLAYERAGGGVGPGTGPDQARVAAARAARLRGEEYLLARGLLRRLSTGEVVDPAYLDLAFPFSWHYDVLRALDHLRASGAPPDPRTAEAVAHVRSRRRPDGRWALDRVHPGAVHLVMDGGVGEPNRWITLRALRVLAWADGTDGADGTSGAGTGPGAGSLTQAG